MGRVAGLLLANGQTSQGVAHAVERLSRVCGHPVELLMRWGDLTVQPRAGRPWRAGIMPVAVDIRKVAATEAVVDALCGATLTHDAALARLDEAAALPPLALSRFAVMAGAGAAALSIIFGAAESGTVALVAASAGLGALVRRALSHWSHNPLAQPFGAALLAGVLAAVVSVVDWPVSVRLVAVCPCMVLVPGPHILNGSIDLVRGRTPLGAIRLVFAATIIAAISVGLLAGLRLAMPHLPPDGATAALPLARDIGAAGVAVAAYGSFFNMPWRLLPASIGIGMAAHAVRWVAVDAGAGLPFAALLACAVAGCATAPLAHRLRLPFGATAFSAVVSLMPGLNTFEVASAAMDVIAQGAQVRPDTLAALAANSMSAVVIVIAMTAGLIVPKMLFDVVWRLSRPAQSSPRTPDWRGIG